MAKKMKRRSEIIGLTGTNGAGKGEAAAFFQKKGFTSFSLSDLVREELKAGGLEPSRDNLIKKGNELRQAHGPDILARRVMSRVKGRAVIDSIRNPEEVRFLKSQKNFILLAIDAPVELRFKRVIGRGRMESATSLEEFIKKEAEEKTQDGKGQQLQTCLKMADRTIVNDTSLEAFHSKLEEFL
jgi:dephospho-CoA kinase